LLYKEHSDGGGNWGKDKGGQDLKKKKEAKSKQRY